MAALVGCLVASAETASNAVASLPSRPPLTSLAQVLGLTNEEAGHEYRFRLRAQVTLFTPKGYFLFLQNGTTGIYAMGPDDSTPLHFGDWIEAEGVTARGRFAPILHLWKAKVVGHGPLPQPFKVGDPIRRISEAANVWATLQCRVLRSQTYYTALNFDVSVNHKGSMKILLGSSAGCDSAALVDADVLIHGVLGTLAGGAEDRVSDAMYVAGCKDIEVTASPHQNWSLPLVDISRLLTYHSGTQIDDMVRVSGVVTLVRASNQFFLQKGSSGILIEPIVEGAAPRVGENVEALGRIVQDEQGTRRLGAARFRSAAAVESFYIRRLTEKDLDRPGFAGALVRAEGEVVARELMAGRGEFGVRVGTSILTAELPLAARVNPDSLPEVGDRVEVRGVALVRQDMDDRAYSVRLESASPADMHIVAKRPIMERVPWGRVSLVAIALACGAFFWVSALRNRVQARTRQLEEANRRAEQAREHAEQASRAKGEFLANMSHEIRTPMNGILGMTEAALETPLNSQQRNLIDTARFSAESLLTIINDILDLSKIEAGKLQLDPIPFGLRKMLAKGLKVHAGVAANKGLKLLCDVQPNVPDTILSDLTRLWQVITNLLGNALKFTSAGEIELMVSLDNLTGDEARLHFSVRDTGIGIPADKQQSIFEAFSQADASTTRKFGGTGLGLTISSKIVQMLGGKLWVDSEAGKGSCFHFTVVAKVVESQPEPVPTTIQPLTQPSQNGVATATLQILLAEDNVVNQKVAVWVLERQGHSVTVADSGKIVLDLLRRQTFDIILMDIQMPEMDGIEATLAIRKNEKGTGKHIPIIAFTAHAMAGDRERYLAAGMDGFASKPIRADELKQEIDRLRPVAPSADARPFAASPVLTSLS